MRLSWTAFVGLVLVSTSGALAGLSFTPIADPISAAGHAIYGRAISSDGAVVTGQATTAVGGSELFQWTAAGGVVRYGSMPGDTSGRTVVWESSGDGSVVIGQTNTLGNGTMFRWTAASGFQPIPGLPTTTQPRMVSPDGSLLAGTGSTTTGWAWTAAGGTQGLTGFAPWASTTDGSVLAGFGVGTQLSAAQYTQAFGVQFLPMPATATGQSIARDITGDGTYIAGDFAAAGGRHAFRWSASGGTEDLGIMGSARGLTMSVSEDGSIVAGMSDLTLSTTSDAWVWQEGVGLRLLDDILTAGGVDLQGWRPTQIWDASADGRTLTGQAIKNGIAGAFVATIPEPNLAALAVLAGVAAMGCTRRRSMNRAAHSFTARQR